MDLLQYLSKYCPTLNNTKRSVIGNSNVISVHNRITRYVGTPSPYHEHRALARLCCQLVNRSMHRCVPVFSSTLVHTRLRASIHLRSVATLGAQYADHEQAHMCTAA